MTVDVAIPPLVNADWHDAEVRAYREPRPLLTEYVPVSMAIGRVLAADITAATPLPSFTASAMDGWAVAGAGPWRVVGTDTVVRLERGSEVDGILSVTDPHLQRNTDIRRRGEELGTGAVLARSGTTVTPPLAGLAAAAGQDDLPVRCRWSGSAAWSRP